MKADELVAIWPKNWPRKAESTNVQCEAMVRKFGRDFVDRDIKSIDRAEMREWCLANLPSARYVRSMLADAERDGLISTNVASALKLPIVTDKPVVVPTLEQVTTLATTAREGGDVSLATRIEFAAYVGLRFGEQRAVLREGTAGNRFLATGPPSSSRLDVSWQRDRGGRLKIPKTPRSVRVVLVPQRARDAVSEALRAHSGTSSFLWPASEAKQSKAWKELRREAGIWIKWHHLRHFAATWFLDRGATTEDVAVQLGCDETLIRSRYGHPSHERALERLEMLDESEKDPEAKPR